MAGKRNNGSKGKAPELTQSDTYTHEQESVQRPDVGIQPKKYRYNSWLGPELCWDESAKRDMAEWLLNLVANAAQQGETNVFAQPQCWSGTDEVFNTLARLTE